MTTKAETTQSLTVEEIAELRAFVAAADGNHVATLILQERLLDAAPALLAMASRLVELESALEFFAERGWWSATSRTPGDICAKARELGWTSPTQKQGDR